MMKKQKRHIKAKKIPDLKDVLQKTIRIYKLDKGLKKNNIIVNWEIIIGRQYASLSQAIKLENKILFIKVSNPQWRNEFNFLKNDIIERVNSYANKDLVKKIILIS